MGNELPIYSRPPIKAKWISIRVSAAVKELIKMKARQKGINSGQYLRWLFIQELTREKSNGSA